MEITPEIQSKIISTLIGTSSMDLNVIDEYEIEMEDIEELMLNNGYERCGDCGVWVESSELVDEEDEPRETCESCSQ